MSITSKCPPLGGGVVVHAKLILEGVHHEDDGSFEELRRLVAGPPVLAVRRVGQYTPFQQKSAKKINIFL